MTQRNGDGLEVKAERGSKKELTGSWVHTKRQSLQGMEVEWVVGLLETTAGLKGSLGILK